MSDRIFLNNLRMDCRIGVTDEEREKLQQVIVDVSLILNLKRAGTNDKLDETVSYIDVMNRVSQFVSNKEFKLAESLAEGIAGVLLEDFSVERVIVSVRKAKYSGEPSIGIEIQRDRVEA